MDTSNDHGNLLLLIGQLVYKNQLLREAIVSKDETINLVLGHLITATASGCTCEIASQLVFVQDKVKIQDSEFANRSKCRFNEFGDVALLNLPNTHSFEEHINGQSEGLSGSGVF